MSSLFTMADNYKVLFDMFDEIDELMPEVNENGEPVDDDGNVIDIDVWHEELKEQWFAELSENEEEFEQKAENVAQYIKGLNVEIDALASEIKTLQSRKKAKENKIERMKKYLKDCMLMTNINKIETAKCVVSVRNNAESVSISDEKEFINQYKDSHKEYFKFKPEISKTEIKKLLQSGEKIEGAILERTQSVIVK